VCPLSMLRVFSWSVVFEMGRLSNFAKRLLRRKKIRKKPRVVRRDEMEEMTYEFR
jgi:hypothetical protein